MTESDYVFGKPMLKYHGKSHRDHAKDDDDLDGVDLRQTQPPKLMPPRRDSRTRNHHTSIGAFNSVGVKRTLGLGVFAFFVAMLLILDLLNRFPGPRVLTPITASSKLMESPHPQFFEGDEENSKESLYWGTYRPRVYLGIRARTRRSLIAGLMWIGMKDGRYLLRHVCQDSDELSIYSWKHRNDQNLGHQVIVDHDMNLATSFFQSKGEDSGYGGDWAVRVDVQSRKSKGNEEFRTNADLFFYLADEDGNALALGGDALGVHKNYFLASGLRTDVGSWQLHLKSLDDLEVHYFGLKMPRIHNLSDLVQEYIGPQVRKFGRVQLPDISDDSPNILIFQISARIPFKTDFAYISGTDLESSRVEQRVSGLTGTLLTSQLMAKQRDFDTKFEKSFNLSNKVDQVTKFDKHAPPSFAKQVMSQARSFIQKKWEQTQRLVKDAQTGDTRTVIRSAATKYKQYLLNQSSKLWMDHYPEVQSVTEKAASAAAYWSAKYNHMVKNLTLMSYNISSFGSDR